MPNQVAIDDLVADLETIRLAKAEIAKMTSVKEAAEAKIKDRMGEAEEATIGGRVVLTWKRVVRQILNTDQLKLVLGPAYAGFLRESEARTFLVKD